MQQRKGVQRRERAKKMNRWALGSISLILAAVLIWSGVGSRRAPGGDVGEGLPVAPMQMAEGYTPFDNEYQASTNHEEAINYFLNSSAQSVRDVPERISWDLPSPGGRLGLLGADSEETKRVADELWEGKPRVELAPVEAVHKKETSELIYGVLNHVINKYDFTVNGEGGYRIGLLGHVELEEKDNTRLSAKVKARLYKNGVALEHSDTGVGTDFLVDLVQENGVYHLVTDTFHGAQALFIGSAFHLSRHWSTEFSESHLNWSVRKHLAGGHVASATPSYGLTYETVASDYKELVGRRHVEVSYQEY